MKIVFVLHNFFFEHKGGAELQAYYFAKELVMHGNEVYYIRETGFSNKNKIFEGITLFPIHTNKLFRLNYLIRNQTRKYYFRYYFKKIKPDIVYTRSDDSYLTLLERLKKEFGYKLLWACSHDRKTEKKYWIKRYGRRLGESLIQSLREVDLRLVQTDFQCL